MPIHEIRETIEVPSIDLDANGFGIIQKQINLRSGQRHNVHHLDIFQDAIPATDGAPTLFIEWFVSPFPIIYSNMNLTPTLVQRGAMAGQDSILMKAICDRYTPTDFMRIETFPNQFLGAQPTFTFSSPMLYLTGFVHGEAGAIVSNLAFSFYVATDSKKIGVAAYGLALIRERSVAQGMNLMQQGRTIPATQNVGQIFPMWKYGGARPERMLRGNALADFFLPYASTDSEKMLDTANVRTYLRAARTMQGFDQPFGALDGAKGQVPDWIRFELNRGLVSGPIRANPVPLLHLDNGNVKMV